MYAGECQMNEYEKRIDELEAQIKTFEAHAVEVLADYIWSNDEQDRYATLDEARAEARALLGWEE